jgi:lipid-binding SYLF domain-containing protein
MMPDQGIPEGALLKAQAVAIFPNTISAGIGIGGQYGQGVIMVNNKGRWSSPAIFTLGGGSIGWQIGGQATDIVLLFMDKKSVDALLSGKVKLGADASVAAGPVGRSASAATDVQFKGGILSYSRSKGLFIGIKLEGAVLAQHWDADKTLYGKEVSAEDILIKNKVRMPRCARPLVRSLRAYSLLSKFM